MKNKIISVMFCLLLGSIMILNILAPDRALSYSERRPLAQKPSFTKESFFGGSPINTLETYAIDQFAGRDAFRTVKALSDLKIFGKLDNNNIYVIDNIIFKQEYPLNAQSVTEMASKLDRLYELYLKDCNVMLGIIPDKGEYVAKESGHLSAGYEDMTALLLSQLQTPVNKVVSGDGLSENSINYLDLKQYLTLDDFYKTDLHWKQENLSHLVSALGDLFGFSTNYDKDIAAEELQSYHPFYGAYYGQSALKLPADKLSYVTDKFTENATVKDFDQSKKEPASSVYNTSKLGSVDSYDLFFSGNSPLITINNPLNTSGKELIVFRDSFGSSLAPLLLEGYSKITLIDLRFIPTQNVGMFVDFMDQDVLLLYSQNVLNNSQMLK